MECVLAEAKQEQPKIAFDLNAVEIHRDIKVSYRIFAEENPMRTLHVEAFDRKNVRGALQFFAQEEKRSRFLFLASPPENDWRKQLQFLNIDCYQSAEDIQIGGTGPVGSAGSRAVENRCPYRLRPD